MFFFRFEDKKKYPTDEIVSEILNAKDRGIDIKVILDIDRKTDPFKSKEVNTGIYEYLKSNGIEVVFDYPEELTHSKLIVADEKYTIVGSHNLTAGSFFAYDDTSVFIDSEDYARQRIERFDKLWDEYKLLEKYPAAKLKKITDNKSLVQQLKKLKILSAICQKQDSRYKGVNLQKN